jgi:hypothetical protein
MSIAGKWRITEMDLWDQEAIDLVGPAFIEVKGQGGQFRFIAVEGWMHCQHKERNGRPYLEFTWDGNDEYDPASGRGWAKLEKDGCLNGRIYIHDDDDSGFRAIPFGEEPNPCPRTEVKAKRETR